MNVTQHIGRLYLLPSGHVVRPTSVFLEPPETCEVIRSSYVVCPNPEMKQLEVRLDWFEKNAVLQ